MKLMIKNHVAIMVIVMIGHALDTIMDIIEVITMDTIMAMDIFTIAIIIIIMTMVIIMGFINVLVSCRLSKTFFYVCS